MVQWKSLNFSFKCILYHKNTWIIIVVNYVCNGLEMDRDFLAIHVGIINNMLLKYRKRRDSLISITIKGLYST